MFVLIIIIFLPSFLYAMHNDSVFSRLGMAKKGFLESEVAGFILWLVSWRRYALHTHQRQRQHVVLNCVCNFSIT